MDWLSEAKRLFKTCRPDHFTNYKHCEECEDHDRTLLKSTIDSIGLKELGNPGWDPVCFMTVEAKKYYMPSFISLSLETVCNEFYFGQMLFHLEGDGVNNELYLACNNDQRRFIQKFVEYMILNHSQELNSACCEDDALRVYEIWSKNL